MEEKLGIIATIGFTLIAVAVTAMFAYVLSAIFFVVLDGEMDLSLPVIGLVQASPKLQSWAAVLTEQYRPVYTQAAMMAALQILILVTLCTGVALGYGLRFLLAVLPPLPRFDPARTYELWLRKVERRWLAIAVLAVVILFEVLRSPSYQETSLEAAPYFDVLDVWFDLTPLLFAGFLLAQVIIVRRRARKADSPAR